MTGKYISRCRLCDNEDMHQVINFGSVPLGNNLQESAMAARQVKAYPLNVLQCDRCSHFQLGYAVAPETLYATNYTYLSGVSRTFREHLAKYAVEMAGRLELRPRDLIVDIGSNDGTGLQTFKDLGMRVIGVDPASGPAKIAQDNGIETLNKFFDERVVEYIIRLYGRADFITSHNVLAHVDDLRGTFRNIYALLKNNGHFCFEVGYFKEVIGRHQFDTIYHEHLDYHHAGPLVEHLAGIGFDVLDISTNEVQGGSLRVLCKKASEGKVHEKARNFIEAERESVLYDRVFLDDWKHKADLASDDLFHLIQDRVDKGLVVAGYGAPTKATLLMQMADLGDLEISYIVEDTPGKIGKFMPRTGIPIKASSELLTSPPGVLIIFAWNFASEIINKLAGKHKGPIEVIVPLPELRSVWI